MTYRPSDFETASGRVFDPNRRHATANVAPLRPRRRVGSPVGRMLFVTVFCSCASFFGFLRPDLIEAALTQARAAVATHAALPSSLMSPPDDGRPDDAQRVAARAMPICGMLRRVNCVVDGDTFWLDGEKIRIQGIDAPETRGACTHETRLAARATARLQALVDGRRLTVRRTGMDRFGRTLADVSAGSDIGERLVGEGLAQPWAGHKAEWCDA